MENIQMIQMIVEKVKEAITGEIRQELRDFRNTVSGQLEGFKLAIESINARQTNLENEVRNINQRIDQINQKMETMFLQLNNRIDETNSRMETMFLQLNNRIDETNRQMETMFMQLNQKIDEVNKSLNQKIEEVNKSLNQRIDEVNKSLNQRIDEVNKSLNQRMDLLNNRIDRLVVEMVKLSERVNNIERDVKVAVENKRIVEDLITRMERIEEIVYKAS